MTECLKTLLYKNCLVWIDEPVKLYNAPALPRAPTFKGSTKAKQHAFMSEYQRYTAQVMPQQTTEQRHLLCQLALAWIIFLSAGSFCFDLGKFLGDVMEQEWVA
ncbi:hypothetical protein H310_02788 [Aphanomyces invadans]|uniref:Uncharacterized protein n=1 Tax=Aphanomyces invadans TaxID=157072 RepID=A0A024UJE8_9STRA|nr:hypothetical protein H310_02788 [Aphanomyces invadans]ETW06571.1 hypothetical protein H310_02788 [Aphanomyces invadans]|eukprot:XP_008864646.1 hypothetical protein H310_02788 [Aphanomyces invadans]